jgi:hypothetical protein
MRTARRPLGEYPEINLILIDNAPDNTKMRENRHRIRYVVRHGCCGREESLSHEAISRRLCRGTKECRWCQRKGKPHNYRTVDLYPEYSQIVPPTWPVPGSVK